MTYLIYMPQSSNRSIIQDHLRTKMGVKAILDYETLISKMSAPILFHNDYRPDPLEVVNSEFRKNFWVENASKEFKNELNDYYSLVDFEKSYNMFHERNAILNATHIYIRKTVPKICKFFMNYLKHRNANRNAALFINDIDIFFKLANMSEPQYFATVVVDTGIESLKENANLINYMMKIDSVKTRSVSFKIL